jgi:hypothetical protein
MSNKKNSKETQAERMKRYASYKTIEERMEKLLCEIVNEVEMLQKSINKHEDALYFKNAKMRSLKLVEKYLRKKFQI